MGSMIDGGLLKMERRSGVLLLALLPLGLMCSAFNEPVLSEACDRYKDVPAGEPSDFENCQTEQAVAKKFGEGVRQKLPASLVANCIYQAESWFDRVGRSGLPTS